MHFGNCCARNHDFGYSFMDEKLSHKAICATLNYRFNIFIY